MTKFTPLHNLSNFSLLSSPIKIPDLIKKAKDNSIESLALVDNGNLYGSIFFYEEALKNNIKPIIGVNFYLARRTMQDRDRTLDRSSFRLILLAKNKNGYDNLLKLTSDSHLNGFYYKPRIDKEILEKYSKDLVCIIPHIGSEISEALKFHQKDLEEKIKFYQNIFSDDLYLEITRHSDIENHDKLGDEIIKLAKNFKIELVASQEVQYLNPEDKKISDILFNISNFSSFDLEFQKDFYFKTPKQINNDFKDLISAVENSQKISDKCNLELKMGDWIFPKPNINEDSSSYLLKKALEGVKKRGLELTQEVNERIEYELLIINKKKFADYFLVLFEIIEEIRRRKVAYNTRGSAAGSLISYLLFISNTNPLKYKLTFERFLNPDRPSAPDIDLDIADIQRDSIIAYVSEKFGRENVAQIVAFGTMAARGSVRDVCRSLKYPYELGDKIAKLIPIGIQGSIMTLDKALIEVKELRDLFKTDNKVKEIIEIAQKIEGCARHTTTHAGGIIISPQKITNYTPIQYDQKREKIITQFEMNTLEKIGLIKFDFLGLTNLTILQEAINNIKEEYGKEIDILNIPDNDPEAFKIICKGLTIGIFQLSGDGMTEQIIKLQPNKIQDIIAILALYRPGPLKFIPNYIRRKNGEEEITYFHPKLEKFLLDTYGLIIYQEDVLLIARELAGYSWLESDKFRKAIGKKIPKLMQEQKEKFFTGCSNNNIENKIIIQIWEAIETFAAYGFNKAHATSYAILSYQTAYLKAHYLKEYMLAVLKSESGNLVEISRIIEESRKMNINILSPDINKSFVNFSIFKNKGEKSIVFGLSTIKNFGQKIAEEIIFERKKDGEFSSMSDFIFRMKGTTLTKKSLEALIFSGCFDKLIDRKILMDEKNIVKLLSFKNEPINLSNSLFNNLNTFKNNIITLDTFDKLKQEIKKITLEEKLKLEKETLGIYLSGHPLDKYKTDIQNARFNNIKNANSVSNNTQIEFLGIIKNVTKFKNKKGDCFVRILIEDLFDKIEAFIFNDLYEKEKEYIKEGQIFCFKGRISLRDEKRALNITNLIKRKNVTE